MTHAFQIAALSLQCLRLYLGFTVHWPQPFGLLELVPKKDKLTGQTAKVAGCCLFYTGAILFISRFSHIQSAASRIRKHTW